MSFPSDGDANQLSGSWERSINIPGFCSSINGFVPGLGNKMSQGRPGMLNPVISGF